MGKVTIRRSDAADTRFPRMVRALLLGVLLALPASCVEPLASARSAVLPVAGSAISIALAPPTPFDPAVDPLALLQPLPPDAATTTTGSAIDPAALAAALETPFVMPGASAFSAGSPATPYVFRGRNATDTLRASLCLTAAIYYEAANEPDDGQRAVAQVVLNRVRHPAWPSTVCDVVYQGTERPGTLCQFTFGCDGAMARAPSLALWIRARRVAQAALAGYVFAPVGLATNYHTLAVAPSWGKTLTPAGIFGAHIFYRLPGGVGSPRAFIASYRGNEPVPGPRAKIFTPADPAADAAIFATAGMATPQALASPETVANIAVPAPGSGANARVASVSADRRYVAGALPESDIRDEYRSSGQWISR